MLKLVTTCCLVSCIACASVKVARFDAIERRPTTTVDVYSNFENIDRGYKEIALITADDEGWGTSETDLLEHLKKKAMSIGADAIVLQAGEVNPSSALVPYSTGGAAIMHINRRISKVIAIVYLKD
jgi:hypothetical protein